MLFIHWKASHRSKYQKIKLKTPENHHEKKEHMGALPHMLSLKSNKETTQFPLCRKGTVNKIVIRIELCMTKYITYIYKYKTGLDQIVK